MKTGFAALTATASLLVVGLSSAEYRPARTTEFTWDSESMVAQECEVTTDHYYGIYRTDSEGHVVISWETKDRLDEQLSWSLVWSLGNSRHVKAIEVERSGCGTDSWCDYVHVKTADLRELQGADRAALRLDMVFAQDAFIDRDAHRDLFKQWADHWCDDPDGDGRYTCQGIDDPADAIIPPMRQVEQKALAACLEDNHIYPAQQATSIDRVEYPLAGVLDWVAEAVWAEDCPEAESLGECQEFRVRTTLG